jgi:hypothetical protein
MFEKAVRGLRAAFLRVCRSMGHSAGWVRLFSAFPVGLGCKPIPLLFGERHNREPAYEDEGRLREERFGFDFS